MSNTNSLSQADLLSALLGIVATHGARLESVDISTGLVSIRFPVASEASPAPATTQANSVPAYEVRSATLANLDEHATAEAARLLQEACLSGKRTILPAVKAYREITGKYLGECKNAVEDIAIARGYGYRDKYTGAYCWLYSDDR